MKATSYLLTLCVVLLLWSACEEESTFLAPDPIWGFSALEATLDITGDTLQVPIYLTRALTKDITLALTFTGTASVEEDFLLPVGSELRVPAGQDLVYFPIVASTEPDPERIDRTLDLELLPHPDLVLSTRDSMRILFALPHSMNVKKFAPDDPFPRLWGYTSFGSDPVPEGDGLAAGKHSAFVYVSRTRPNTIGFYSPNAGRSTNVFNMHRIYADEDISSGSAMIFLPNLLEFIPNEQDSTIGQVNVIEQQVMLTRTNSSGRPPFELGLSGGGTYDENAGVILLDVYFDETAIGGPPDVLRRYALETQER